MKENNALEKLTEAIDHVRKADEILNKVYDDILEKEEPKKVKLTIKVENPFKEELEGLSDKEIEQLRKDLEEIINDFTRE